MVAVPFSVDKDVYQKEKRVSGQKLQDARNEKDRIQTTLSLLNNLDKIHESIENYCNAVKVRYAKCGNFDSKRKFLLDTIKNIVHDEQDNIFVYGTIPIEIDGLKGKLEFKIKKIIIRRSSVSRNKEES